MTNTTRTGAKAGMLAFVFGALAGGTLALLYAPKKGADLREDIATTARTQRDRVYKAGQASQKWAQARVDLARSRANQLQLEGRARVEQASRRAKELWA